MLRIRTEHEHATSQDGVVAPTLLLTRRVTFAAAHVLRRPEWDDERNLAVFGACARDHGHNYVLEASVGGEPDPDTGMVVNLRDLDRVVREAVIDHVDHRHLNHDVPFLADVVPTAENLALAFWTRLEACLCTAAPGVRLRRVRLVESENNTVEVSR
jgi:6-pyruvoyltetrahydropterin/6-carboxytetrahydropterin synthase